MLLYEDEHKKDYLNSLEHLDPVTAGQFPLAASRYLDPDIAIKLAKKI